MNPIPLEGCTPEPLMNYLKALGVLKIIVEQNFDPSARGSWKDGVFCLHTSLKEDKIIDALSNHYKPSPVITPWNEAAGFKKAKGKDVDKVREISGSQDPRFSRYKGFTEEAKQIAQRFNAKQSKDDLILTLRNQLPDEVIQWIDACGSYAGDGYQYAPFLGTGGNIGKMDISINYLNQLTEVFGQGGAKNAPWLRSSLFATNEAPSVESTISQFSPGRAGGANATQGTEGKSMINPWDFILMIEGSLFLGSSTSRKLSSQQSAKSVFPFTVEDSAVGNSKLTLSDLSNRKGRGEIWMPVWERPTSLGELKSLFSEGRAELKGRQATSGLDFARAVAGLGVDRGIKTFMRFSIVEFVKAGVMAAPLGMFEVSAKNNASLLSEIDPWLAAMKRSCNDKAPARFRNSLREIEQSIFDYCQHGDANGDTSRFQRILISLGKAERIIAGAPKFRADAKGLRPIARLSSAWITAAADSSHEWEIALALASLYHSEIGPIRLNLEDITIRGTSITWADRNRAAVWSSADLPGNLAAVLYRRVMMADKAGNASHAITSSHRASLASISAFLTGDLDFPRIADLLWALSLCKTHEYRSPSPQRSTEEYPILPAAYSLLKLLFHPHQEDADQSNPPRPDLGILGLLRADRTAEACQRTVRILRGKNLTAKPFAMRGFPSRDSEWLDLTADSPPAHLAAALLIPISHTAIHFLNKRILRTNESHESTNL
jgi:CRISPR-associated protein Csx17